MVTDILQPTHLLFILVVALLVLGPKRLPEVARTLGNGLRDFRSAISGDRSDDAPGLPEHYAADEHTSSDADADSEESPGLLGRFPESSPGSESPTQPAISELPATLVSPRAAQAAAAESPPAADGEQHPAPAPAASESHPSS
ncbi:MAG: twin-arginine translocase TatA/TatE family subunit [Actinomycetota bacterium]|nr:twin-arginine translocase TatA/TatE family subunit [Actinomycetota bacterium]